MKLCALFSLAMLAGAQPAVQPAPIKRLEGNIQQITRSINADWGIYIKCLETGEEIAINADRQMDTMSVIKIPLMAEAFRQIEAGKFSLTDRITGTADVWCKALRAAPDPETFHRQARTPFGLSSPRDMGKLLEKLSKGEAV